MSESLSRRVGRLVSGGFHAIIDVAENAMPEAAMNEGINEVERAIDEVRQELGRVSAQKYLASKQLIHENNRHEALLTSIQSALTVDRDDLAEVGIAEQVDIEARLPIIENTIADCASQEKELEGFVLALQAKLRQMKDQVKQFRELKKSTSSSTGVETNKKQPGLSAEKAGEHFNRIWERQTGLTPQAESRNAAKLKELEDLGRDNRIKERLAALKNKQ